VYGTAGNGGCGILYKVDSSGDETVFYDFPNGRSGGCGPDTGVVRDGEGNFYGTTYAGGDEGCGAKQGCGVVFKIDTKGDETVLHAFTGYPDDGEYPTSVILGPDGSLYGTTYVGGSSDRGTIFKIDNKRNETILHNFSSSDGAEPYGKLLLDGGGNIYGTTFGGGNSGNKCDGMGCGVVFKLDPQGHEKILYNFQGEQDGGNPHAGVIEADGILYGTTYSAGSFEKDCGFTYGCGTVFALNKQGKLTVLHHFGASGDGQIPIGGVIRDPSGTLYGTTLYGGTYGYGTIFSLDSSGTEKILYDFCCWHGKMPEAGVVRDSAGHLYGTAYESGIHGYGLVWKLTP